MPLFFFFFMNKLAKKKNVNEELTLSVKKKTPIG